VIDAGRGMDRIKVAYLLGGLRPGGAERQMLTLAERLPRDHFEIEFLVLAGTGDYDDRARAAMAPVRYLGTASAHDVGVVRRGVRRGSRAGRYIRVTRRRGYDIVDAWLHPADALAALLRPLTHTPVVISGRRNLDPHDAFGPMGSVMDRFVERLYDAVVANAAAVADHALRTQRADPRKVRVIRNGVDPIAPLTVEQRRAIRAKLAVGDDELVIGCVANFLPVKRHDALIDAFAILADRHPNARLALVGDGPLRDRIESRIRGLGLASRVRLQGQVLDARSLVGAFDVAVQTSIREGLPNALLEAAAAGRAIVATDAGGSSEVVHDGATGLLVPTHDHDRLVRAMLRVADDADLRERLGAAAREHVSTAFAMDRFIRSFGELYAELVEAKRGSV